MKRIRSNSPTDFLVMAAAPGSIGSFESDGSNGVPGRKELRVGIFKIVPGEGHVTVFSDSLAKTGELTVTFDKPLSETLPCCFINENEEGTKFDIESGTDKVTLSYSPEEFMLSYDEAHVKTSASEDVFSVYYDDEYAAEPAHTFVNEEKKLTLEKDNERLKNEIDASERELETIQREHGRLSAKAEEVKAKLRAAHALIRDNENMKEKEDKLSELMTRYEITSEMLKPYLSKSPEPANEAGEYLEKANEIIKRMILDQQREADRTTLPDSGRGGDDDG